MYLKIILIIFVARAQSQIIIDDENIDFLCKNNKCLYKCCRRDEYVSSIDISEPPKCVKYDGEKKLDFSNVQLYDDEDHWRPVSRKFGDTFLLKQGLILNETFAIQCFVPEIAGMSSYISQSGILYLEFPNAYDRWTPIESEFCLDYANGTDVAIAFWVIYTVPIAQSNDYISIALITSSFFLALLLVVYAILPELRNIGGMVLMAYVFSLMVAFLALAAIQIGSYEADTCVNLTIVIYFFFLAAFAWMNVMSYDIWWTFRGYAKARPIHRRGEKFKFCMYCMYAWGVPLAMALAFMKVNEADLSDQPWIIKPLVPTLGCFLEDGQKLVYLYFPMLIMISGNWLFFGMTTFNVWRLRRGTQVLNSPAAGNPAAHRSQKRRFTLYLKLSAIMGINWLLEVVSSFYPDLKIWYISDAYNLLIGITIFLIFIWKESILNKLKNRYKNFRRARLPKRSMTASITLESTLSQETQQNVCPYPNVQRKFSGEERPFLA
ncbi:G-protein coupled receptor Mth2-like isoform X1 [Pieris napi]|uniref:G-protein coupled receptor Mth2-like isoform X1 n=1 Tax=Pieris napi TaxID=78633 RepID=UPI001FB8CD7C|nr:G-protein coupled receptor Mth2-like isoform X1 [Pieris napi]